MLPVLEGIIRRRVLLNFRVEPGIVEPLLPSPLKVLAHNGYAIVGICLIGMERLRPKGFPAGLGLSSENMAHRVAIRYPSADGLQDGVFIWRRDTDQCLVALLGGRLFPGVSSRAEFTIREGEDGLSFAVTTADEEANLRLEASYTKEWQPTAVFPRFPDVCEFFKRGDCGFSCSLHEGHLDGLQLKTLEWDMSPLRVTRWESSFFQNRKRFPPDQIEFDSALLMRGIPHEWHELTGITEMAGLIQP